MLGFHPVSTLPISTLAVAAGGNNTLAAPLGTLTLTGLVPTFTQGNSLTAPLGTLTLTGLVPTITQGNSVTAPLGTLTLTGLVPTFTQPINLIAPLGTMTLTGLVPTITQGNSLTAPLGTVTLTGLTPTFDQTGGNTITAPLGMLTLMGLVPAFSQSTTQPANVGGFWPQPSRSKEWLGISKKAAKVIERVARKKPENSTERILQRQIQNEGIDWAPIFYRALEALQQEQVRTLTALREKQSAQRAVQELEALIRQQHEDDAVSVLLLLH